MTALAIQPAGSPAGIVIPNAGAANAGLLVDPTGTALGNGGTLAQEVAGGSTPSFSATMDWANIAVPGRTRALIFDVTTAFAFPSAVPCAALQVYLGRVSASSCDATQILLPYKKYLGTNTGIPLGRYIITPTLCAFTNASVNQSISLALSGTTLAGTYALTIGGQKTAAISATATAAQVTAALAALPNVGYNNVVVTGTTWTGSGGTYTVTIWGQLAGIDIGNILIDTTNLTGTITSFTAYTAVGASSSSGIPELQWYTPYVGVRLSIGQTPTQGVAAVYAECGGL